jgi:hypothetical protein
MNPNRRNREKIVDEFVDSSSPTSPMLGLIEFFTSVSDSTGTVAFRLHMVEGES